MPATKKYWLMKSEPNTYSIQDLKKSGKDLWDGVRNYQARNFMMKEMQTGDEVLFYHSNANPPGVVGLAYISREAQPDPTALDPKSKYYDPTASKKNPRWFCVEVAFKSIFKKIISIEELRNEKALSKMLLLKKGQRLSVMPVTKTEYMYILKLAKKRGENGGT
jgi:predicted RNA-binding protein with PUA-like domain